MKLLTITLTIFAVLQLTRAEDEKQIKLEDIENDTLVNENQRDDPDQKELEQEPSQHIQLSYSNKPQDIFVTPQPNRYHNHNHNHKESPIELRTHLYHLPKVHESEQTYSVPAKQTLIQPIIGGSQPIQPLLTPQPHYIYIQSPHHHHQQYMPQAQAFIMVPYSNSHYPSHHSPVHHHILTTQAPAIYAYQHPTTPAPHEPSFQTVKSIEYSFPAATVTPLQTSVDYKQSPPHNTIVPKKTLPSIHTTSFEQYYSPGLEFHYTETVPITKLSPHSNGYSYSHAPTHNYHTNYVSQAPSYNYFPSSLTPSYNKHQSTSSGLLDSFVPSLVTYPRQQQTHYKNYYPSHHHQYSSQSTSQLPQNLFTPSQSAQHYAPYPSPQAYNTIQYSVPLPPYEHSKRSTSKATASLSVKAPKAN